MTDPMDNNGSHTTATVANEEHMLNVQKCSEPKIGDLYYKMRSNPRGFCLIFNIFEFPNHPEYELRRGSETEAKRLKDVFSQLYFIPQVFDNPTKEKLYSTVEEFAAKKDLEKHDAIVIIVLSHGKTGGFLCKRPFVSREINYCLSTATDGRYIQFKDLVEKLNNKNCLALINKPKLFFFSCCRGNTYDYGIEHQIQALDDMNINAVSDTIPFQTPDSEARPLVTVRVPIASDIMICYSTVDGYVSWRCEQKGTWLGWALSQALLKHSHEKDLLQLLTIISSSIDERKFGADSSGKVAYKQVIEVILRGFKKSFYFNPGYPSLGAGDAHIDTIDHNDNVPSESVLNDDNNVTKCCFI